MKPISTFKSDLIVKSVGAYEWQIMQPFYFYFNENDKETGIIIEEGFITDFASIPRYLWSILPPVGLYTKAAVVHDYLYKNGFTLKYDRKFCDKIFLEAMQVLGVGKEARYSMYCGVRIFGKKYFILN